MYQGGLCANMVVSRRLYANFGCFKEVYVLIMGVSMRLCANYGCVNVVMC